MPIMAFNIALLLTILYVLCDIAPPRVMFYPNPLLSPVLRVVIP
jgi:hypothetical protein